MGDGFDVDVEALTDVAADLASLADAAGRLDVASPLGAVRAALPGSQSSGAAGDVSFTLSAALAVWAGRVADAGQAIDASARSYDAKDRQGAAALQNAGPTS